MTPPIGPGPAGYPPGVAFITIPENCGKVRVVMALGGKYAVWNGKDDWKHKLLILCRNRKQAEEIAKIINAKTHNGQVEVHG